MNQNEDDVKKGAVHGTGSNLVNRPKTVHIPYDKLMDMLNGIALLQLVRRADGVALEAISGNFMHWCQLRKETKSFCYRILSQIHKHIYKVKSQIKI